MLVTLQCGLFFCEFLKRVLFKIIKQIHNNIEMKNLSHYIIEHARLSAITGALPIRLDFFPSCCIAVVGRCISSK